MDTPQRRYTDRGMEQDVGRDFVDALTSLDRMPERVRNEGLGARILRTFTRAEDPGPTLRSDDADGLKALVASVRSGLQRVGRESIHPILAETVVNELIAAKLSDADKEKILLRLIKEAYPTNCWESIVDVPIPALMDCPWADKAFSILLQRTARDRNRVHLVFPKLYELFKTRPWIKDVMIMAARCAQEDYVNYALNHFLSYKDEPWALDVVRVNNTVFSVLQYVINKPGIEAVLLEDARRNPIEALYAYDKYRDMPCARDVVKEAAREIVSEGSLFVEITLHPFFELFLETLGDEPQLLIDIMCCMPQHVLINAARLRNHPQGQEMLRRAQNKVDFFLDEASAKV